MQGVKGIGMILMQWHMKVDIGRPTSLSEQVKCTCQGVIYERLPKSCLGTGLVLGNKNWS